MLNFLHFLLMGSIPAILAMPEPVSPENWEPPEEGSDPAPPPLFPFPAMDGRMYSEIENMTLQPVGVMETYCQVLTQGPVPVPPDQIPWFCQCTTCKTLAGPKGDRGDRGLPGPPGSPGRRGMTGFRGPPGFVGRPGVKGQKGDEGEKGSRGLQGLPGPKGDRGFKGDKGDRGFDGRPGEVGPKGDDGVCSDTCQSSQGPPGPPGLQGPSGPRGLAGSSGPPGPRGAKGDMGVMGKPGTPGSPGVKGELGPQGECNCTDGEDGSPGQKGDKGDKGDQGKMGPPGKTGQQGDKGNMGFMGMMGPPGPCMPPIQSAFCAGLVTSYPPPMAPVVFARIIYNLQGHYNSSSGVYTAPINGTYIFNYHLTVYDRVLKIGLFNDYKPVVLTTDTKILGTTSQSVILHLAQGSRVWLQVKDSITNGMFAASEGSSTFSGHLLHPDRCDLALVRSPLPQPAPPQGVYNWGTVPGLNITLP